MKRRSKLLLAAVSALCAGALILLLRLADVAAIGPAGTAVGLSHLNTSVFRLSGVHLFWYDLTDWLGIGAILVAFVFAVTGFAQLVRRRSILKVDREILALGALYLAVIGLYVLFELKIVNYRPILMPGAVRPEASFPSSHTMLVCVILGSAMLLTGKYVKNNALRRTLRDLEETCDIDFVFNGFRSVTAVRYGAKEPEEWVKGSEAVGADAS